jgi:2-polyprenyl-3-methyl-5-hydroxy-6-metoxy-1,4-benzoquinol methylase
LRLLDVGASSGVIDNYLAGHFGYVIGIDIDARAISWAQKHFQRPNLEYAQGDAMMLAYPDQSFDVVVCSHVYEHVPDARIMFDEIFRVLKPGGFCYFSGNNRVMLIEPHHRLPFLSLLPQWLADFYMRKTGKGRHYYEKHLFHHQLKALCKAFQIYNYSPLIVTAPQKFNADYMLRPGSIKWMIAFWATRHMAWATPHIWLLRRPYENKKANGAC